LQFGAQRGEALDVVGMLVRDENPVEALRSAAHGSQSLPDLAAAKARIDKQSSLFRFQIRTVARRAAAENRESNWHAPTLGRGNLRRNPFAMRGSVRIRDGTARVGCDLVVPVRTGGADSDG